MCLRHVTCAAAAGAAASDLCGTWHWGCMGQRQVSGCQQWHGLAMDHAGSGVGSWQGDAAGRRPERNGTRRQDQSKQQQRQQQRKRSWGGRGSAGSRWHAAAAVLSQGVCSGPQDLPPELPASWDAPIRRGRLAALGCGCFPLWRMLTRGLSADMDGFKLLEHIGLELDLPVISELCSALHPQLPYAAAAVATVAGAGAPWVLTPGPRPPHARMPARPPIMCSDVLQRRHQRRAAGGNPRRRGLPH